MTVYVTKEEYEARLARGNDEDLESDDSSESWSRESETEAFELLRDLPQFRHGRLLDASDQLRLLKFVAGPCGVIACSMETFWADEAPEYAAISYVWGSTERRKLISLNGHQYGLTRNCHYALSQVSRMSGGNDYVWVDSICVNQEDLTEKAMQVQRMGRTYENASRVYSCVGKDRDQSEKVMQVLQRLHAYVHRLPEGPDTTDNSIPWTAWFENEIATTHFAKNRTDEASLRGFWISYDALCKREYWKRVWIVQETWLAREIVLLCGAQHVSIEVFRLIWDNCDTGRPNHYYVPMKNILSYSRHLPGYGVIKTTGKTRSIPPSWQLSSAQSGVDTSQMDIITALYHCRVTKCSDYRDRVYALQHIVAWPKDMEPLVVDYSIEPVELLCQVLRRLYPFPDRGMYIFVEIHEFLSMAPLYPGEFRRSKLEDLRRRRNADIATIRGLMPDPRQKAVIGMHRYIEQSVLRVDTKGCFTTDIQPWPSHWGSSAYVAAGVDEIAGQIRDSRIGVPLEINDVCVGRLPSSSSAGDLLLRLTEGSSSPTPCWLVARHSEIPHILEIVGAAVLRLEVCSSFTECLAGYKSPVYDIYMDPEDLLNLSVFIDWSYYKGNLIVVEDCVDMRVTRERFSSYIAVRERTEDDPPEWGMWQSVGTESDNEGSNYAVSNDGESVESWSEVGYDDGGSGRSISDPEESPVAS